MNTVALAIPRTNAVIRGAPGGADGVAAEEAIEASEKPASFRALTVNVYLVPFSKPLTTHVLVGWTAEQLAPPGLAMTAYPTIAEPFVLVGAVHETTLWRSAFDVAVTPVGAPGLPAGMVAGEASDNGESPRRFVAFTLKAYEVPFVRPLTVQAVPPAEVQLLPAAAVDPT